MDKMDSVERDGGSFIFTYSFVYWQDVPKYHGNAQNKGELDIKWMKYNQYIYLHHCSRLYTDLWMTHTLILVETDRNHSLHQILCMSLLNYNLYSIFIFHDTAYQYFLSLEWTYELNLSTQQHTYIKTISFWHN